MNTIPTIFNEKITPYTAVGGKERFSSSGISAIVLNNHGQYPRRNFFQDLEKTGFDNVISIETASPRYDIEELSQRFPFVRFVLPEKEMNLGEKINLAAAEIDSPLFFVMRSDMRIIAGGTARRMAERLVVGTEETDENAQKKTGFKRLCTVPVIMNSGYEIIPSLVIPMSGSGGKKMRTVFTEPHVEGHLSLYPFDGIGIYDRSRFIQTGGFDITLNNAHWQFMDFGFRAHLWGEEIALSIQLKLLCEEEMPAKDCTADKNYSRFYLKNLAPVFKDDYAHLPYSNFPRYILQTGMDFFTAWDDFRKSRKWVKINKFRWKCDPHSVTSRWDSITEHLSAESHDESSFPHDGA